MSGANTLAYFSRVSMKKRKKFFFKDFHQSGVNPHFVEGSPEAGVVDVGAAQGVELSLKKFQIFLTKLENLLERSDVGQTFRVEQGEENEELKQLLKCCETFFFRFVIRTPGKGKDVCCKREYSAESNVYGFKKERAPRHST
jgi:hypothetical protein